VNDALRTEQPEPGIVDEIGQETLTTVLGT
jgi:hypothetical protein